MSGCYAAAGRAAREERSLAAISTVAPRSTSWQGRADGCRFSHQLNGDQNRIDAQIIFAAQAFTVKQRDLAKRQPPELCSTTCWINQ